MRDATRLYYLVFGLLTLVGGISGYFKARSIPSLVAGVVCGCLLFGAAYLMKEPSWNSALTVGLLVSISLAGKFVPDALHKKAFFPGGFMAVLSVISVTLTLLAWYKH